MMILPDVNLWSVLAAAVASVVLGSLWYGSIFGKAWMELMGMTKKDMEKAQKKGMMVGYLFGFLSSLVIAFAMSVFATLLGASLLVDGAVLGIWVWLGFVVTTNLTSVLWEGKSRELYTFNMAYQLVNFILIGAVLVLLT